MSAGSEIPLGLKALHLCDNPSCCNPSHLVLGTIKANTFDMINKGRDEFSKNKVKGEKHHKTTLNSKNVLEIRRRYNAGELSQGQLGKIYNVSQVTVGRIVNRDTWAHI